MKPCPECGKQPQKVIYYGLPILGCFDCISGWGCPTLYGFWIDHVLVHLPFNGKLFIYEGPYLFGLWHWLTHNHE